MNNIIIQIVRLVAVLAIALFAFVSDVFAAPVLLQPSVIEITGTSAVLRGYLQTNGERTLVRFEWSEASSSGTPAVVGLKDTFFDGFFNARLDGLTPGTTYSYRAIASSGGVTTVTTVASFKTANQADTVLAGSSSLGAGPITLPAVTIKKTVPQTDTSKAVEPVVATKQETAPVATKEGFTNRNTAAVIGAGDSIFPTTLIGWIALLVSILVMVLVGRMIYESTEKRKKTREEEEEDDEDKETE